MTTYLDTRIITLTSDTAKNKHNGSMLSNVEFEFISLLRDEHDIIRSEIAVLSAEIPVSFYNVTTNNNVFVYSINNGASNTITIPVGNYNANSLIAYINSVFVTQVLGVIAMSISSITGKISLARTDLLPGQTIQYSSVSTTSTILGFVAGTNYSANILIPPYPVNLLGVKRISICSDLLPTYSYTSVSNGLGNTLSTIEVDQPPFGLLLYKNTSKIRSKLRLFTVDNFDIKIKDEFNNFIDFNNCSWTITLVLDIVRVSPNLIPRTPGLMDVPAPYPLDENDGFNELDLLAT